MPTCLEVFEREGVCRPVAGNQQLLLAEPGAVWLVRAGHVDVFAAPFRAGTPAGARVHLFHAEPGQLLWASPSGPPERWDLLAAGTPDSEVLQLPQSRLRELAGDPDLARSLAPLVERWIEELTASVVRGQPPRTVQLIDSDTESCVKAETIVSPRQGVLWIGNLSEPFRFLGHEECLPASTGDLFPLAWVGWAILTGQTKLLTVQTKALVQDPRLEAGLDRFHRAILSSVAANAESATAADRHRWQRKTSCEDQALQGVISQLAAAIQPEPVGPLPAAVQQDPLLAACQLVGEQMGLTLTAPRPSASKAWGDHVGAIARASGVRTRRVLLAGDWWRQESGPLLGFRAADGQPVALLPTSPSRYLLVDPVTGSREPLTAVNAALVQAQAHCFYRSFDARSLTARDIFQFGLVGTRRDWWTVVVLGLGGGLLGLLPPIATALLFGRIIPGGEMGQLALMVLALAVSAVTATLFQFTEGVAMLRLETRMATAVEAGVWDRLLSLPASFFRHYASGDLAVRAMGIARIRQVLTEAAMSSLLGFLFSLVSFALLFYYDVWLAALATLLFVLVLGVASLAAVVQLRFERGHHQVRGRVAGLVLQLLTGISRLRVAAAENRALAVWAKDFSLQNRLSFQAQSVASGVAAFMGAVPILASLAVFAVVARRPPAELPLATFLAFNAAFVQILAAAIMMSSTVSSLLEILPLYERAKPILQELPESHAAHRAPRELSGEIEMNHVSFRYDAQMPWVLEEVSLHARPGEFVAIVGPSGAGKSTILRLLLGFETPTAGSLYYDREDLVGLDRQAVRRQIGVVLQSHRLSSGDIFSNITGGSPAFTLNDAWEAARLSGLEQDIRKMPMGMYTVVTDGEGTLSGGQRQRLMIARAMIAKPRIFLFDEATSALDNLTQTQVSQSLAKLKATRIVVAHRLSTVMHADRIYVLDRGRVVQQGTYSDLLAQPGMFADLAKRQLLA